MSVTTESNTPADTYYWHLEPYIYPSKKGDGTLTGMIVEYYQNLKALSPLCLQHNQQAQFARFTNHANMSLVRDKLQDNETFNMYFGPVLQDWNHNTSRYEGGNSHEFVSETISLISTKHRFSFVTLMGKAFTFLQPFLTLVVLVAVMIAVFYWILVSDIGIHNLPNKYFQ